MKEFLHNGEKVIYQEVINKSFLDLLNESGIVPEEVPDENLRYRVFKYAKDGENRYACVLVTESPDDYVEKVYITFKFPEDGFYNMMLDITGQLGGDDPDIPRSRLRIAAEQAENKAHEWVRKKFPDKEIEFCLMDYPEEAQKEFDMMYKLALNSYGYYLDTLDKISAPDVDMDYMRKMLK